jgi:hypothetical protein
LNSEFQALKERLLRIAEPKEVDGKANCELMHVSLDSDPEYEALSYTWTDAFGDSTPRESLLLDEHTVAITHNLNLAIRTIFLPEPGTLFWVDALCIHQLDVDERSSQVSKMHEIYRKAKRVVAWLGVEHDNSKLAIETLLDFTSDISDERLQRMFQDGKWEGRPDLEDAAYARVISVIKLFQRPYWARVRNVLLNKEE